MSVSPSCARCFLSWEGSKSIPSPSSLLCEGTHHILRDSSKSAWAAHSGIWALLAHVVLLVSESEFPQETLQMDQKALFCPAMVASWSSLYTRGNLTQSTIHKKDVSPDKEGPKEMLGPVWAFGHRNSNVLQTLWPHSPACLPNNPKAKWTPPSQLSALVAGLGHSQMKQRGCPGFSVKVERKNPCLACLSYRAHHRDCLTSVHPHIWPLFLALLMPLPCFLPFLVPSNSKPASNVGFWCLPKATLLRGCLLLVD